MHWRRPASVCCIRVLQEGKIYIVRMQGGEICARHLHFDQGFVRLKSSNDRYEDLRATGGQVLGRVVGQLKMM